MNDELKASSDLGTHEVTNQPLPAGDGDLWAQDEALRAHARQAGAQDAALADFGALLGSAGMRAAGREANRHSPELVLFDAGGRRLDEVRYHPAYHRLLAAGFSAGYAALPWEEAPGGHATHAAMVYQINQIEPGVACPLCMTYSAYPVLRRSGVPGEPWLARITSREYDPSVAPVQRKKGASVGMAMTEKQGGSDLRANTTRARRDGEAFRLTGHKWFCSAPMSDGFLTLAQVDGGGLTCFFVPRWLEGERNAIRLMRLKDKLGNRSNASAEIEFADALAWQLGEEGRGVRTIIEMVHHTRLDTAMAPAGLMRAALARAKHWCEGRVAFQKRLIDQPLMRAVLADLVLDWEAALALGLRVAQAYDGRLGPAAPGEGAPDRRPQEAARAFARIAVALAKFNSNKRCVPVIYEAMEALGGMGFVEDTPMPMLFRESPLNSIWEGSGNVICLDVLRTLAREPLAGEVLQGELAAARGVDRRYDAALRAHQARWPGLPDESEARWFVERLAVLLSASVLIRRAPGAVADGYVATRVAGARGQLAGAVSGLDTAALIARI